VGRRDKARQRLLKTLHESTSDLVKVTRKAPRQVRMFSTATSVSFATDMANHRTVIELVAGDRPGLLAETSQALRDLNIFILMAKIVTVGERAEDVFYVTDKDNQPLSPELLEQLRTALVSDTANKG
jgi:[protein-PII] uridylyltransferase